jgi:DNA-binding NarL/FixJ family response regulator
MKRILVADDHEAVRLGLRSVLGARPGWEVVAEAHDGRQALAAAIETRPDVAIVDYSMPLMSGIEVTRHIRERQLAAEVLIFTMYDSRDLALQAVRAGAHAYLLKSDANKLLLAAVESLMQHKPFCGGAFSGEFNGNADSNCGRHQLLSPREETIVRLIAEGHSNKEVSSLLSVSIKTTETHRAAAMRKLNVRSTAGLVRFAVRNKLLEA